MFIKKFILPCIISIFSLLFTKSTNAQTWTPLFPTDSTSSTARWGHSVIYDTTNNSMTIFGGFNGGYLNDVWVLNSANGIGGTSAWTQLTWSGNTPKARYGHTAIYDSANNLMTIYGGYYGRYTGDTWILSNANGLGGSPTWTQLSTQGPQRAFHTAVYDTTNNRMTIFGGIANGSGLNDIWVLSNANGLDTTLPVWTHLTTTGTIPSTRWGHTAVYDNTNNRMIIFGGEHASNSFLNDVWVLSNTNGIGTPTWTELTTQGNPPSLRSGHSAVYDVTNNLMMIYGGFSTNIGGLNTNSILNDVWVLNNANGLGGTPTWKQLTSIGNPTSRYFHSAIYDANNNLMTIFAGSINTGNSFLNDVWVLNTANGGVSMPEADFYGNPTSGSVPLDVQFYDTSSGNIANWLWNFGDGNTSSEQNPIHTYTSLGSFSVSLIVSNSLGTASITKNNYISTIYTTAGFTISGFILDTSGNPVIGEPIWIRGAGVQYCPPIGDFDSTGPFQIETDSTGYYQFAGLCDQTYQVIPPGGSFESFSPSYRNYYPLTSNQSFANFTVTYLPIPGPTASFIANPLSGYGPLSVNFTDNSSNLYGNSTSWSWDFGDGFTSDLQNPAHVYSTVEAPTSYTVQLIVTTDYGVSTSIQTNYITVTEPGPNASFNGAPTWGNSPLTVYFFDGSDNLNGNSTSWNWIFGDGSTSNIQNPIHTFVTDTAVTAYTVRLITSTPFGTSTATQKNYIIVFPQLTFDSASDTTNWVFQNANNVTYGIPSVSWLSTYQGHTGILKIDFNSSNGADEGFKMTGLDRYALNPNQPWYRIRVVYYCDSPCDGESILPVILLYSDNTTQVIQEIGASYTGNSLIQPYSWYTIDAYAYCHDSSAQLQLIAKNNGSTGNMYIDSIELDNVAPPAISNPLYVTNLPGVPMSSANDTTHWGFELAYNKTNQPQVSWVSSFQGQNNVLEFSFDSANQGVKMTSLLGDIPAGYNAIMSFNVFVTNPSDIVVEGFLYGEKSLNPFECDIAGYVNAGLVQADQWTTLYVPLSSVSQQSTFRLQILVKNNAQSSEQVFIDDIQLVYSSTLGYGSLLVDIPQKEHSRLELSLKE